MIGRLNMYVEPGTILGPNTTGELVTAFEHVCEATDDGPDCHTTFRHAQTKDFQDIAEPRSVTEHAMIGVTSSVFGPIRTMSPYEMPIATRPQDWAEPARKILFGRGQNGQ